MQEVHIPFRQLYFFYLVTFWLLLHWLPVFAVLAKKNIKKLTSSLNFHETLPILNKLCYSSVIHPIIFF